jgi:cytochrome c5
MKNLIITFAFLAAFAACGPKATDNEKLAEAPKSMISGDDEMIAEGKGIGEVKTVELTTPLDPSRIQRGKDIYDMKCSACHNLDTVRMVGPGWEGLTQNRKPEWIMNMVTNVDVMLERDPEAQKLLQLCLTRMPNQNVSIGDARDILEFMRQNDAE